MSTTTKHTPRRRGRPSRRDNPRFEALALDCVRLVEGDGLAVKAVAFNLGVSRQSVWRYLRDGRRLALESRS